MDLQTRKLNLISYLGSDEKVRNELNLRHSKEDSTIVQPLSCNEEVDLFLTNKLCIRYIESSAKYSKVFFKNLAL